MAMPKEIILHYSFDQMGKILDTSGNNLHGSGEWQAGPGQAGRGNSIFFNKYWVQTPNHKKMNSKSFSVTFWLFMFPSQLNNNKELRFCPLLQKGVDDKDQGVFHRSPLVLFDRKEKKLKAMVSTSDVTQVQGESIESNAKIMENKWVHVALVRGDK